MKIAQGDLFEFPDADCLCVTTNGIVKPDGRLVMGAGIAKVFRDKYLDLDLKLGALVTTHGNYPYVVKSGSPELQTIMSFPTKDHFAKPSIMGLIHESCLRAMIRADEYGLEHIYLTPPGCGHGKLLWEDVSKVIFPVLDDRFCVVFR